MRADPSTAMFEKEPQVEEDDGNVIFRSESKASKHYWLKGKGFAGVTDEDEMPVFPKT